MKKLKEFLSFFIPFILLAALWILVIVIVAKNTSDIPSFAGRAHYLKLLLEDTSMLKALINSYSKAVPSAIILPFIAITILRKKLHLERKQKYLLLFIASSIISFAYYTSKIGLDITYLILALQIGIISAFLYWLAEFVVEFFKKFKNTNRKGLQ